MKKTLVPFMIGACLLAAASTAFAWHVPFDARSHGAMTIAVFGDSPYGTSPTDTAESSATPAFIDTINADRDVSLALHVGDIHSGSQYCTEAYDRSVYNLWTRFQVPLVYTPGDNEWTDCHKAKEGGGAYNPATGMIDYKRDANGNLIDYMGGDPVANLDLVRSIFFVNPGYSLGAQKHVLSQFSAFDRAYPTDAKYVENVMWEQSKVLFVTLNIPGGSNNDSDVWYGVPVMTDSQARERSERTAADLHWLAAAFARARAGEVQAVVIQTQADMWDTDGKDASHLVQYKPFIDSIAAHAKAFRKPVLLLNGDSHAYRSDNPLVAGSPCMIESSAASGETACSDDAFASQPGDYDVPNFHRVTVHGSTFPLEWLKLGIDAHGKEWKEHGKEGKGRQEETPDSNTFGPFSWQRMIMK